MGGDTGLNIDAVVDVLEILVVDIFLVGDCLCVLDRPNMVLVDIFIFYNDLTSLDLTTAPVYLVTCC